ncbi:MAG: CHRD domain-containing protein [Rhodothalassiaceae bacterium]
MSMKTIAQIVAPALLAIGLTPSAEAGRVTFTNVLEAGQEVNADGSPAPAALTSLASGTATLTVETNTASAEFGRYALSISVSDLIGQPLGVAGVGEFHIHDGDAGTNGPIVVTPLVEAGLFDPALDGPQALGTLSTDFGSRTILQDAVTGCSAMN